MSTHNWTAQQRVVHGEPLAESLPREITEALRIVLVTTRSLADSALVAEAGRVIGDKLAGRFAAMRAHSPVEDVLALAALLRESRCDLVVAIGGGSVIDGTKAACFATWRGIADVPALKAAQGKRGQEPFGWPGSAPSPRFVAVPTTLSAAEFAPYAGVTDLLEGRKFRLLDAWMVPVSVLLDPAATLATPAELFLSSGIRAVDHAAERWCAAASQPFSDAVSLKALELLAEGLRAAHSAPADLAARALCQQGAWLSIMGGWAGVPVGASHGIGYILGGARGVPHGFTSCVMLPAVMQWNEAVNGARQADVARIFGGASGHAALRDFIGGLGLPNTLGAVGIVADEIPGLAARWLGDAPIATNPRPVTGAADIEAILRLAL
ncbi:MAG: iron-containing alcohol dehydrogenase [Alphaproteobacteria bacterium]|nr:iron-containing alcohol dehydrogenase [Alphaproteobacteria bacterium]